MAVTAADLKWQATFDVLPQTVSSSTQLQGDKILLPQSALEGLLAAASALSTQAVLHNGDQVVLPSPLTFRLTNIQNRKFFYAGILEFSAPESTVAVSPLISNALGLDNPSKDTEDSGVHPLPHRSSLQDSSIAPAHPQNYFPIL